MNAVSTKYIILNDWKIRYAKRSITRPINQKEKTARVLKEIFWWAMEELHHFVGVSGFFVFSSNSTSLSFFWWLSLEIKDHRSNFLNQSIIFFIRSFPND
jgi:hypothetical protein